MKRIYLIIFTCFAVLATASAQKLTVESMTVAGNDISASQYRVNDLNGQACALVRVQLATPGATFAGNVIGSPQFKEGEYWVYVTAGTKELEVKHKSFVPCHVTFSDYGIQPLQGLTTYELTLLMPQLSHVLQKPSTPIKTKKESRMVMEKIAQSLRNLDVETATGFKHGLCAVRKNNKWGFIDKEGRQRTAFMFDEVMGDYYLTNSYWIVGQDKKWGVVDDNGLLVVPCKWYSIEIARKDTIVGRKSKSSELVLISFNEERKISRNALSNMFGDSGPYLEKREYFVDINNKKLFGRSFDYAYSFSEGVACVKEKDNKWYVIDQNGGQLFHFPEDIIPYSSYGHGAWGADGRFHEGLLAVCNSKGKKGFVDLFGNVVVSCLYDDVDYFSQGIASVLNGDIVRGYEYKYINKQGETVLDFGKKYRDCERFGKRGWALVDDRSILIDTTGQELLHASSNSLNRIWWGSEKFEYTLAPICQYDSITRNKKYGYVDENLHIVVPLDYYYCDDFEDEFTLIVDKDRNFGFIDLYGTIVFVGKQKLIQR